MENQPATEETVVLSPAQVYLEEGWYTIADLESYIQALRIMNVANLKSLEKVCGN